MKQIPDWAGYLADNRGQIWSTKPSLYKRFSKRHKMSAWRDRFGYLHVTLRDSNGKRVRFPIHVLIARTYIGPRPKGLVICHENGNKNDNRPSNLRYTTQRENIAQKMVHGTYICGDFDCKAKITDVECREILSLMRAGCMTQRQIAKRYGVSEGHVSALKHGRIRKHLHRHPDTQIKKASLKHG